MPPTKAVETELKFLVPANRRQALRRVLETAGAHTVRLQAAYFDCADRRLAGEGLALRLRREGRQWVQALKGPRGAGMPPRAAGAPAPSPLQRFEHEVVLRRKPALPDPALHAGTAAGERLAALLADGAPLELQFTTDVRRLQRRLRSGGATIELAFDEGRIVAGERVLPVCELELELVAGPPRALLALAERWVQRHHLEPGLRTKAERGWRLAGAEAAAVKPRPIALDAAWPPGEALAAVLHGLLARLLPHAADVADGSPDPEAVHQARVGLRRLRSVLRLCGAWSGDPARAAMLEQGFGEVASALGAQRDADVLDAWLRAEVAAAAGAPELRWPAPPAAGSAAQAVRSSGFARLFVQTLQLAEAARVQPLAGAGADRPPLPAAVAAVLARAWRAVERDARDFETSPPEQRHRLRRRLKRLRYVAEALQAVLPPRPTRRALAAMTRAADALGRCTDAELARERFEGHAADEPRSWFVLGWLAARLPRWQRRAARSLATLQRHRRFWR